MSRTLPWRSPDVIFLAGVWALSAVLDRLWFVVDRDVPAWDPADYLTGALNFWHALQTPQWLSGDWWTSLWQLTSKVPPLTYLATVPFLNLFGTGLESATLLNLFLSAVLLASVYTLGAHLFSPVVGRWAAVISLLMPGLYQVRLNFLTDYPLVVMVTLCFVLLTLGRSSQRWHGWPWAVAWGAALGLALLVKQTAIFFLLVPLATPLGQREGVSRRWRRRSQGIVAAIAAIVVAGPWYRTNWLLVFTSGKRATVDSAIAEGDPSLLTLDAWTYYGRILPYQVSWPLLLVPLVGLLGFGGWAIARQIRLGNITISKGKWHLPAPLAQDLPRLGWLLRFLLGAYILCSLNVNKDGRYTLAMLPVLSVLLAYGLTLLPVRWRSLPYWTAALGLLLLVLNVFPVGGAWGTGLTNFLSPKAQHFADGRIRWPHTELIQAVTDAEPYLRSTLAVLPSTPGINQHNLNYFGALQDFQVYGRQVGTREKTVAQDVRSLDWFVTKTGDQGSVPQAQALMTESVRQSPEIWALQDWSLPDGSTLTLHHRRQPPIQVQPLAIGNAPPETGLSFVAAQRTLAQAPERVTLVQVQVPAQAPPGAPVPVTYTWQGPWHQLHHGLVLLTWQRQEAGSRPEQRWLHDHAIALGALHDGRVPPEEQQSAFQVTERLAMLPPPESAPGTYRLVAEYLDRQTGDRYPIAVPPVSLAIRPNAAPAPAPEVDLVTQFRTLAQGLPQGRAALDGIFEEIGRISQYDPVQDYAAQLATALGARLQQEPNNAAFAYGVALAEAQQRHVPQAIAALERVTALDPANSNAHAYLAVVNLYDFRAKAARQAIDQALTLAPESPEIHGLSAVAALMRGNLVRAWRDGQFALSALEE